MPKISVVIPTYNRGHLISRSIDSILEQAFNDFEIIVIDDGSTDNTKEALKPYRERIHYFYQENKGISGARNRGIQEAKGEYIAFTDDDIIADPHWLASLFQCVSENNCDAIGGRVLPVYPDNIPLWIRKNPTKIAGGVVICDYGESTFQCDKSRAHLLGANFMFRKQIFDECGPFEEGLIYNGICIGEDLEIIQRIIKENKNVYYCGKANVYHPVYLHRLTLRHSARWHIALGRFTARQEWKNKEKKFVCWFGVPRYLYRGIIVDFLRLSILIFNFPVFYDNCRGFFRKIGMFLEYRKIAKEGKAA